MITFKQKGDFSKTKLYFEKLKNIVNLGHLDKYGRRGVAALAEATPKDTGLAASSWYYDILYTKNGVKIIWANSDVENGMHVAVLIQYGHAKKNGGWVEGRDYINPAIRPIFDQIADEAWMEVTKL